MKKNLSLLFAAIYLGFTICIYAPYEMYLSNRYEFWFSIYNFWWIPFVFGAVAIVVAVLTGLFLKRWKVLERIYEAALFGIGVCLYVQGNFLNLDVGVANGTAVDWNSYRFRMIIDLVILLCIVVAIIVMAVKKWDLCRKGMMGISSFLTATQAVALFILFFMNADVFQIRADTSFLSEKGLFNISSEENIVVFLMDTFDDVYMKDILKKNPEIADTLDGFYYFSNMTGSYSTTMYSVQYLMSGYYNLNEKLYMDWRKELDEKSLYWDELCEMGWNYYLYTTEIKAVPSRILINAENYESVPLKIGNYFGFTHDLYQFVACKYFPDIVKPSIWLDGSEFNFRQPVYDGYEAFNDTNADFVDKMKKNPVTVDIQEGKSFRFIHLEGCHGPNHLNTEGEIQDTPVMPEDSARGCLRIVQYITDQMKAQGCYDNSTIIIMADHGVSEDGVLVNPVFMMKPKNVTGTLQISNAPVSHKDYVASIMCAAGSVEYQKYGESVFDVAEDAVRERYFYQYYLEREFDPTIQSLRLIEYQIDPEANTREHFHLTDVEYTVYGERIQHSQYCKLCKEGGASEDELKMYDPPREIHIKDTNYQEVLKEK